MPDAATDTANVNLTSLVAGAVRESLPRENGQLNPAPEPNPSTDDLASTKSRSDVEISIEDPRKFEPSNQEPRQAITLKDIKRGNLDSRGVPITYVYAAQADEYAIYQAGEVMVQFADDQGKAEAQRKSILPVSSARAEVNALVQGLGCREVCDRQLGYALQLALDGDIDGAKATVAAAKAFVLAKRAARGRFQYLKWSYGVATLLVGLLFVASRFYPFQEASSDLWLAAKAGLIGAAFSIELAIRGRTVALDTELLDNVTDGTLRLLIGVMSAGVLLLLLACGILPSLKIGDANFGSSTLTWQMVLVVGFVGGFLERLVPDLLEKRNPQTNGGNTTAGAGAPVH